MKNILVPTDFSQAAYNAAIFAAALAKQANARLILFHAYHPAILLEEETIWADGEMLEKEVQEKTDALAHELHTTFGVSVTRVLKPGFAVDGILEIGKKIKADLLIMGTTGAGKRPKTGDGKVCTEILKKAEMPVICIPPEYLHGTGTMQTQSVSGNQPGLQLLDSLQQIPETKLQQI